MLVSDLVLSACKMLIYNVYLSPAGTGELPREACPERSRRARNDDRERKIKGGGDGVTAAATTPFSEAV
jgi:hypothetical protein